MAVVAVLACVVSGCAEGSRDEGPPFVQRADSRLVKVQSVGLAAFGPINPHTATPEHTVAAFGEPSSSEPGDGRCRRRWDDLGLAIEFGARDGGDPCGADAYIDRLRLRGAAAATAGWRTAEGIRPMMRVAAALRTYPEARGSGRRLVLVEGPDDGETVTVLAARATKGQVRAMRFPIGE